MNSYKKAKSDTNAMNGNRCSKLKTDDCNHCVKSPKCFNGENRKKTFYIKDLDNYKNGDNVSLHNCIKNGNSKGTIRSRN